MDAEKEVAIVMVEAPDPMWAYQIERSEHFQFGQMPRGVTKTIVPEPAGLPKRTFVLDNGAYNIKAGFAPTDSTTDTKALEACEVIPNCLVRTRDRKTYVAAQCNEITQWNEAIFRRPLEHGQLVNWEAQKEIWDQSFFHESTASEKCHIQSPADTTLILTETPNTMPALQKNADEIIMEEWGFGGYLRVIGTSLNAYNDLHPIFEDARALKLQSSLENTHMECLLVIDSGYSHTIITPIFEGRVLQRAVRRLDFGGKHLTNLLKEVISVRHFDLHQDMKIVNDIKEDISFVSRDFKEDLEKTWKGNKIQQRVSQSVTNSSEQDIRLDYILPDGIHLLRGFSRPHDSSVAAAKKRKLNARGPDAEVSMTLGNERFTIPEIIFNPSDIGSKQPGLVDIILQSLSVLPPLIQATMLANTLVVGGNARISGFVDRLQDELRSVVDTDWMVRVRKLEDPVTTTWLGGARMASRHRDVVKEFAVTKEEYDEHGSAWTARKFVMGQRIET